MEVGCCCWVVSAQTARREKKKRSDAPLLVRPSDATEKPDDGAVAVTTSIGSEAQAMVAFLVVLDPGYHDDMVCAGEVGRVVVAVAGGRLMWAAAVGAATAAGVGRQLAAAPAEHMRAARDQDVQTLVSPVGEHTKA